MMLGVLCHVQESEQVNESQSKVQEPTPRLS